MGTISITIPMKINGRFKITDKEFAKQLVQDLESKGEKESAFDDVFGIWAERPESEVELTESLRRRSNRRDG
jgi:hypothetical protein